jgi:hypothetical protein
MSERVEPDYELHSADEVLTALREAWDNGGGGPMEWTGPDSLHHSVAATCPEPSWYLGAEGLAKAEENGRDALDNVLLVAFHLGFHNGAVKESVYTKHYAWLAKVDMDLVEDANKRATAMTAKVDRCEAHMREILGYAEGEPDAGLEAMLVRLKRYYTVTPLTSNEGLK